MPDGPTCFQLQPTHRPKSSHTVVLYPSSINLLPENRQPNMRSASVVLFLLLAPTTWTVSSAFLTTPSIVLPKRTCRFAYGDLEVQLEKPLGLILQERGDNDDTGVQVVSLVPDGNAAKTTIAPGDVLVRVQDTNVSEFDFDSIMDLLGSAPSPVSLTLSDGLGTMDIAANLAKRLTPEEAVYADAVVRQAVREIRRNGRLGDLLQVEIVIGAAVRKNDGACLVRFFAIFSTDTVSTYSCNVSAAGVRRSDGGIDIIGLSCAKDEGLGQTVDLILEDK